MDNQERKLVIVLLAISFSMMISGCFFVPFVVHIWTYIANLAGEKDMFLAATLVTYFVMFALIGAAAGVLINTYGGYVVDSCRKLIRKITHKSRSPH